MGTGYILDTPIAIPLLPMARKAAEDSPWDRAPMW